jgi:hypothetical protein
MPMLGSSWSKLQVMYGLIELYLTHIMEKYYL